MSKTEIPSIRFRGFDDAWEQRKLGDILQTLPFKAYLKSPDQDGRYEVIQQGSDPIIGYANGEPCRDYKNTVIFGDHTLSLYKPKKPFFVATDGVRIVKGSEKMDGNYLLPLLERNKPQSEGYKRYYSILADIDVFFTENHKEQSKIGEYFSELDHLITLHQRKFEKLTNVKKSMLEKMFPRNGSCYPEIRFKGFTDPWEQRKLGDLLQTLPFKQFLKEPEPDGKYEIIQQGNEPVIGFANGTPCGDYKDVVIFGDHTLSLYKPQHPFFVATDGVRIVKGQQDTDGYYLLSLLERYKPQSEGYKRYYSILADTNCITTYNTSEQEKIGVFFKLLDNLITLHQCELEKLQSIKKSLLEKMFV